MGVSLADLVNDKRTVPVQFQGRTIKMTYHPHALNHQFYAEQRDRATAMRADGQVMSDDEWAVFWLSRVVCGWDLTDGKHEAPITEENLNLLGTRFLLNAIETISTDLLPNPTSSPDSPDGSGPTGS